MLRSALWVFAGKLGNQVITLLVVMILARLLTPEDFGIVAASQIILTLSQVVVRFGIGAYLIQSEVLTPKLISTAQTLMLGAALVISAILLALANPIGAFINVPQLPQIMPVLLASFVVSAAINPAASVLSRNMEFKFLAKTEVVSQAFGYGAIAILLSYFGFGYWAIILGTLAQTLMRGVQIFWRMPVWPTFRMHLDDIKPMLQFGGGVFFAQMMSNTAQRVDNLVVTTTAGPEALGYYSRAYSLMEMTNALIGSVARETLFSGFSKKRREGKESDMGAAFIVAHAFAAFIVIPIMMLTWLFSEKIVWILLGPNWTQTVPVLEILAFGMFFRLTYKVSGTFVLSQGAVYHLAFRNMLYAFLVLVFGWIGSSWGISGVAWGVFLALGLHFVSITASALSHCKTGWIEYVEAIIPFLMAGIVSTYLAYQTQVVLSVMPIVSTLTAATVFLVVYGTVLFVLRRKPSVNPVMARLLKLSRSLRARV